MIKYRVYLTPAERVELEALVSKGTRKATDIRKANVLLASDENGKRHSETAISEAYHLSTKSVERIRREFCESGMEILTARQRKIRSDKLIDGTVEAYIVAVSCSEPPVGQSCWKLQTIADRIVALGLVEHLSHTSVATVLKKMRSNPGG